MKPPVESPHTQPKATAAAGAVKQKPVIEPPTEPFINLSGDGPVDPTKFQRFIIPMEFIQKANSVELPGLDPDDLRDTGEQSPLNPSNPPAHLLPDTRAEAHEPVVPPPATIARPPDKSEVPTPRELQTTTKIAARRPPGLLARWALTGKMPTRVKVVVAAIVALVFVLILSYTHLKAGGPTAIKSDGPVASQAVTALDDHAASKAHTESQSRPPATTSVGEVASAPTGNSPESLPLVVESPIATKPQAAKNRALTAPKPKNELPTRSNANAVAPAPSASATVKGVIPVIEPE